MQLFKKCIFFCPNILYILLLTKLYSILISEWISGSKILKRKKDWNSLFNLCFLKYLWFLPSQTTALCSRLQCIGSCGQFYARLCYYYIRHMMYLFSVQGITTLCNLLHNEITMRWVQCAHRHGQIWPLPYFWTKFVIILCFHDV